MKKLTVGELILRIKSQAVNDFEYAKEEYTTTEAETEIIRRDSEKDERIKELEGIVKNYQETCEKMINR